MDVDGRPLELRLPDERDNRVSRAVKGTPPKFSRRVAWYMKWACLSRWEAVRMSRAGRRLRFPSQSNHPHRCLQDTSRPRDKVHEDATV